jgi:hypothetical protein
MPYYICLLMPFSYAIYPYLYICLLADRPLDQEVRRLLRFTTGMCVCVCIKPIMHICIKPNFLILKYLLNPPIICIKPTEVLHGLYHCGSCIWGQLWLGSGRRRYVLNPLSVYDIYLLNPPSLYDTHILNPYTHIHIHTYTHIHIYTYTYTHTHIHIHIHL